MNLIDTHCHIHDSSFFADDRESVLARAYDAGVGMVCVGTSERDSLEAVHFAAARKNVWAIVGVHPHDTKDGWQQIKVLLEQNKNIVGVGEIGLDYFYDNSPREVQQRALEEQLQWALEYDLPVSFHVRDAFDDFWPIFANFPGVRGVLHSFTDTSSTLEKALSNGLYIGVNGISTFAKDKQTMWSAIPMEKFLLETDAPFLTPVPLRGKVNEPAFVRYVAEYHASQRGIELETFAEITSANAHRLFSL